MDGGMYMCTCMYIMRIWMDGWMYAYMYMCNTCMHGWMDACHFLKLPTSHEMFIILLFILRGSSNGPAPLLTLFFPPLQ